MEAIYELVKPSWPEWGMHGTNTQGEKEQGVARGMRGTSLSPNREEKDLLEGIPAHTSPSLDGRNDGTGDL